MNAYTIEPVRGPVRRMFPYAVMNGNGAADLFRTQASAEHAARMLNANQATINPHGLIGCRVEPLR